MTSFLISSLESKGAVQTPLSNVPFTVEDRDSVWYVESGRLDLFVEQAESGRPAAARFPIVQIHPDQAVFGLGSHVEGLSVFATALPDTRIRVLSREQMQEIAASGQDEAASVLLQGWIQSLISAVSEPGLPNSHKVLDPGRIIVVGEQPTGLVPNSCLVWVSHTKGCSQLLADSTLPTVNGGSFFPISRKGWLLASPGSELVVIDSKAFFELEREWQGLDFFHSLALRRLQQRIRDSVASDTRAFEQRKAADRSLMRAALSRLAATLLRTPGFLQAEEGCRDPLFLACQAVGKHIGIVIKPSPEVRQQVRSNDPVASIAKASRVRVRKVALRGEWWTEETGALLAFVEQGHRPVAILPRTSGATDAYDPEAGTLRKVDAQFASTLHPLAYTLYRPFPAKKLGIFDLLRFGVFGCAQDIVTIVMMGIAAGLLGTLIPYLTGVVFDWLIPRAERTQLETVAAFLLAVSTSIAMFAFVRGLAVQRFEGKVDGSLQAASWDRLLSLPVSFFRGFTAGDLAQRSLGISHIREILTGSVLTAILSGIFSIFSFLLLFYYTWKLAMVAAGLVGFTCLVTIGCGLVQLRYQRRLTDLSGALSSKLLQFINGVAKFRVSATETRAFSIWAKSYAEQKQISFEARRVGNLLTVFNASFPTIATAVIFWSFSSLGPSSEKGVSTGDFLAFLAAFTQFLASALYLSSTLVYGLNVVPIYERARPIFSALPEVTEQKAIPGRLQGNIELSQLNFRYRLDAPLVLRDLSLKIAAGQFVAFVGPSGGGKSTLLRLILGFELPEAGAIYFDDQDLSGLDVQAVRSQIGVVLQSSRPIGGSIFENIVGSAPLSLEQAWEAARLSGLADDIKKMPMGMHTYITEGGGGISGGQRQRLMVARAIVRKPRIVLFDEATSALDNHTQAIVSSSLAALQVTRIVIAHRLTTIMNADRICVIEKGTISQSGSYTELLRQEGTFRHLAKRQLA